MFETLPNEAPAAIRFHRGALKKSASVESSATSVREKVEIEVSPKAVDFFDNEPVNFIDKLPKTFYADMVREF